VLLKKLMNLVLPQADLLMGVFDGGALETRTMSRVGCLDYSATPWEAVRPGVLERHVSYKFNRYMSIFGGEVASTQLKFPAEDGGGGWTIHDVVTLHNVPFGDYFRVRQFFFLFHTSCSVCLGDEISDGNGLIPRKCCVRFRSI